MPKVRFCPECSNNFSNFTNIVEKENGKPVNFLVYSCQSCLYQEKMKKVATLEDAILFNKDSLNKLTNREITTEMCLDKSLPRTSQVQCPNTDCPTNKDESKREIVFFNSNRDMKLGFICCACQSRW